MKYDFYDAVSEAQREKIVAAQQILFGRVLRGIPFSLALEIGPGFGGFVRFCAQRKVAYRAIEENPRVASRLVQQGYDILVGPVQEMRAEQEPVDLMFLSHVIEHPGAYHDAVVALERLSRTVEVGGHLVFLAPDILWTGARFYHDCTHTSPTSLCALHNLLTDLGMSVIRSGRSVGRWLRGWKLLWAIHRIAPLWMLPEDIADGLDCRFEVQCYLVARCKGKALKKGRIY